MLAVRRRSPPPPPPPPPPRWPSFASTHCARHTWCRARARRARCHDNAVAQLASVVLDSALASHADVAAWRAAVVAANVAQSTATPAAAAAAAAAADAALPIIVVSPQPTRRIAAATNHQR